MELDSLFRDQAFALEHYACVCGALRFSLSIKSAPLLLGQLFDIQSMNERTNERTNEMNERIHPQA